MSTSAMHDSPLFLSEADVAALLPIADAIACVESAFRVLGEDGAINHPRDRSGYPGAVLNVMWAVAPAHGWMGAKVYPVVRTDVPQSATSTFLLYRLPTGRLDAVLEADVLGQRRTGAASAVATRHLGRMDARVLAVFGAGWQARAQIAALAEVLADLQEVLVVSRSSDNSERLAGEIRQKWGISARSATAIEAMRGDVVVTATGASDPLFPGEALLQGVHVNAVGSNYAHKRELDRRLLDRADIVSVDSIEVAAMESGDLLLNDYPLAEVVELADIVCGTSPGRTDETQITVFESHGLAIEDLLCAAFVAERARARGAGQRLRIADGTPMGVTAEAQRIGGDGPKPRGVIL